MRHPFETAQKALAKIHAGAHAQATLNAVLEKIAPANRSVITELVYGCLRYHIFLQACLGAVLRSPRKLPAKMLALLELGAYSLLYLSDTPAHAVINSAVEIIKKEYGQKLANVCNAVLRNTLRRSEELRTFTTGAPAERLSLPRSLYELWVRDYGLKVAETLARRSLNRPYACYRINQTKVDPGFIAAFRTLPDAIGIGPTGIAFPPGRTPAQILGLPIGDYLQKGFVSAQAAGSLKALEELNIFADWENRPVWDACAGVGGKTLALLEARLPIAIASDVNPGRIAHLRRDCARLGLVSPRAFVANAAQPPFREWAGNILVDAPCSGTGVLGRRPDIKLRWSLQRTNALAMLQRKILTALAALLKPGFELCYITCALNPDENERQIEWLLAKEPQLQLVREWQTPHDHPWLEGMYGARIAKLS